MLDIFVGSPIFVVWTSTSRLCTFAKAGTGIMLEDAAPLDSLTGDGATLAVATNLHEAIYMSSSLHAAQALRKQRRSIRSCKRRNLKRNTFQNPPLITCKA